MKIWHETCKFDKQKDGIHVTTVTELSSEFKHMSAYVVGIILLLVLVLKFVL